MTKRHLMRMEFLPTTISTFWNFSELLKTGTSQVGKRDDFKRLKSCFRFLERLKSCFRFLEIVGNNLGCLQSANSVGSCLRAPTPRKRHAGKRGSLGPIRYNWGFKAGLMWTRGDGGCIKHAYR